MRPLSTKVPKEEQLGRASEETQTPVSRLSENVQASSVPGLPHREDPSASGVRLQRLRVQEQQQRHPEEPLHSPAHHHLQLRLRHMRQTVQDQESAEPSREAEAQRRAADSLRRLRPLQQESSRAEGAHEVQALQAGVRVQDLQKRDDHSGESRATSHLARDQREGAVPHLRQEVPRPGLGLSHASAHGSEAVPLSRLRQVVQEADRPGAARSHTYREEAVRLRHLRPGFRAETRPDLPQEASSRTTATVARRFHQEHRHGVHQGVRHEEHDY